MGSDRDAGGRGPRGTALVLGCAGGVGRALLRVFEDTPSGREAASRYDRLLLIDAEPFHEPVRIPGAQVLPVTRIESKAQLSVLLRRYGVDQLVDLSGVGTLDCAVVCDALGVDLLTAGVHMWPNGRSPTLAEIMTTLLREAPRLRRASLLLAAGMNPGVVNALAIHAIARLAARARVPVAEVERDLYAVLITEEDTTRDLRDGHDGGSTLALTWSPEHALDELLEPSAVFVRRGQLIEVGRAPHTTRYRVRCRDRVIDGMLVPHEEVFTLARRLPDAEIGFVYRLPEAARRALRAHPQRTRPADWEVRKLYPPHADALDGGDCVGVLACTRHYGELWLGFDTCAEAGLRLGTNATELQVAAGILAGLWQLGAVRGVHFVEDLDAGAYLSAVEAILGPAQEVHDPAAPPRTLSERDLARPHPGE